MVSDPAEGEAACLANSSGVRYLSAECGGRFKGDQVSHTQLHPSALSDRCSILALVSGPARPTGTPPRDARYTAKWTPFSISTKGTFDQRGNARQSP